MKHQRQNTSTTGLRPYVNAARVFACASFSAWVITEPGHVHGWAKSVTNDRLFNVLAQFVFLAIPMFVPKEIG